MSPQSDTDMRQPTWKHYFAERFHSPLTAWIILFISLLLTFAAYTASHRLIEQNTNDKFDVRAHEISKAIEDRIHIYEQILWSGVALFYTAPEQKITRQQWAAFVKALSIDQHWPGIQGMGYSIPINPADKSAHENLIRSEGFRDYQIKPEGEREEYSSIVYLEPFDWRNSRAFGYDMWSNTMRRDAMTRARDGGVAATSSIITLVQETNADAQRGFLTYVPVYKGGEIPTTLTERRNRFLGWVYAPFRANNLMTGILDSTDKDIIFDIYNGSNITPENRLYRSLATEEEVKDSIFTKTISLTLQGSLWTIVFYTSADFSLNDQSNIPTFVAVVGLIIDILLFYVILSLHYINRRAQDIAGNITVELQTTKDKLEITVNERTVELRNAHNQLEDQVHQRTKELQKKVTEMEKMDRLSSNRELRVIELKQEVNQLAEKLGKAPPYKRIQQIVDSHE